MGKVNEETVKKNVAAWINDTETAIWETADENGWSVVSRSCARNSQSRYLTVRRDGESIKVRISDHKSVYQSEHFSLSPDGYDDLLSDVIKRLGVENEPE